MRSLTQQQKQDMARDIFNAYFFQNSCPVQLTNSTRIRRCHTKSVPQQPSIRNSLPIYLSKRIQSQRFTNKNLLFFWQMSYNAFVVCKGNEQHFFLFVIAIGSNGAQSGSNRTSNFKTGQSRSARPI